MKCQLNFPALLLDGPYGGEKTRTRERFFVDLLAYFSNGHSQVMAQNTRIIIGRDGKLKSPKEIKVSSHVAR